MGLIIYIVLVVAAGVAAIVYLTKSAPRNDAPPGGGSGTGKNGPKPY